MPVIALTTAAGAPGCTTTALGLALTWPGPTVLVEADPAGSTLASGYFRGTVDHRLGLLSLALGADHHDLGAAILDQCRVLDDAADRRVLLGLPDPAQASAMQPWWDPIADALLRLDDAGYTVLVDVGRLTQASSPVPLVRAADAVLLVCRGTMTSAVRTRPVAVALRENLERTGAGDTVGLAVIGSRDYAPNEVATALELPLVLRLPEDARLARVLSDGAVDRRFPTSALARAYRQGGGQLRSLVEGRRARVHREVAS
ncbi:MinD/ParA family ATP-binding protein [Propionibacteriaceae bacterium Y2011]